MFKEEDKEQKTVKKGKKITQRICNKQKRQEKGRKKKWEMKMQKDGK